MTRLVESVTDVITKLRQDCDKAQNIEVLEIDSPAMGSAAAGYAIAKALELCTVALIEAAEALCAEYRRERDESRGD